MKGKLTNQIPVHKNSPTSKTEKRKKSLISSIFSSPSQPSSTSVSSISYKGNLTKTLFDDSSEKDLKSPSSNVALFDYATQEKLNSAVRERKQKNSYGYTKLATEQEAPINEKESANLTNKDKETILAIRRRRRNNEDLNKLLDLVDLDLSSLLFSDEGKVISGDILQHKTDEVMKEDIHSASTQLSYIVRQMGVGTISSCSSHKTSTKTIQLFPTTILEDLSDKAKLIEQEICDQLQRKGISVKPPKTEEKSHRDSDNKQSNPCPTIFRFHEVASRCKGRLDVRYKTSSLPFTDPHIVSNPILLSTIKKLLGEDAELLYSGLIYSFHDSSDQPWHMDGTALFPELKHGNDIDLPPYAMNIFIPLENDITDDIGPTEFFPVSHLSQKATEIDSDLVQMRSDKNGENSEKVNEFAQQENIMNRHNVIAPLLKKGDALIYDYRVCHRGTANLSHKGKTRIMLYLLYARPWFREHLNFGDERLFSD